MVLTSTAYVLEEGKNCNVSDLLAGKYTDYNGTQASFSTRSGSTTSYIASAAYNDGTARYRDYWFDHLNSNATYETVHITTR
jgi:hypothetical protein